MTTEQKGKHIHLIGIGGTGISAIAHVLLDRGFVVSGSDQQLTPRTADLLAAGATIHRGHKASHIQGAQMVVRSSAVADDNPEVQAALAAGVPVLKRSELVGSLMSSGDTRGIAVAGTHGKTTTAGMIAHILIEAGADPTMIVGETLPSIKSNGRSGNGIQFVVEADEYDHMFLGLIPRVAVVTNIEYDHPDIFANEKAYRQAFHDFVGLLPDEGGRLVICAEDPEAVQLLKVKPTAERVAYGIGFPITPTPGLDLLLAQDLRPNSLGGTDFVVEHNMELVGVVKLRIPGEHNVNNALAAIAVAMGEGVAFADIARALESFEGMGRRFQVKGTVAGVTAVDDYAHHPTEIRATLAAARQRFPDGRIWAVWQPHTYSRTRQFLPEFGNCFGDADEVLVLDVFASREKGDLDMAAVVKGWKHPHATYIGDLSKATAHLLEHVKTGDAILTLNAGDAHVIGDWVLDGLREIAGDSLAEDDMSKDDKKQKGKDGKQIELDATADQVRRLVDRLKQKEEKKGGGKK